MEVTDNRAGGPPNSAIRKSKNQHNPPGLAGPALARIFQIRRAVLDARAEKSQVLSIY
jgi:hypothetical protein